CAVTTITRSILSAIEPPRSFGCGSHCQVHRLASPSAAARTATFTDSPRGARRRASAGAARLALPGSQTRLAARVAAPPQPPLASVVVVPLLPGDPGAVRLAGVAVLWRFAAGAAPVVATLTACALFRPRGSVAAARANPTASLRAVATWASPVVLTAVAACVFAGAPEAPILVLTVAVAPLLALLAPSADPAPSLNRVAGLAAGAAVGLVLWANLGVVADLARLAGVPRHAALTLSAAAAFFGVGWRAARRPGGAVILAGL